MARGGADAQEAKALPQGETKDVAGQAGAVSHREQAYAPQGYRGDRGEKYIVLRMKILWKLYILPHILVFLWYRNRQQVILEDLSAFTHSGG